MEKVTNEGFPLIPNTSDCVTAPVMSPKRIQKKYKKQTTVDSIKDSYTFYNDVDFPVVGESLTAEVYDLSGESPQPGYNLCKDVSNDNVSLHYSYILPVQSQEHKAVRTTPWVMDYNERWDTTHNKLIPISKGAATISFLNSVQEIVQPPTVLPGILRGVINPPEGECDGVWQLVYVDNEYRWVCVDAPSFSVDFSSDSFDPDVGSISTGISISDVSTDIGSISTDVGSISTDIGSISTGISISDVSTDIGSISTGISISDVSTGISISDVSTDIGSISTDIGSISTDIGSDGFDPDIDGSDIENPDINYDPDLDIRTPPCNEDGELADNLVATHNIMYGCSVDDYDGDNPRWGWDFAFKLQKKESVGNEIIYYVVAGKSRGSTTGWVEYTNYENDNKFYLEFQKDSCKVSGRYGNDNQSIEPADSERPMPADCGMYPFFLISGI